MLRAGCPARWWQAASGVQPLQPSCLSGTAAFEEVSGWCQGESSGSDTCLCCALGASYRSPFGVPELSPHPATRPPPPADRKLLWVHMNFTAAASVCCSLPQLAFSSHVLQPKVLRRAWIYSWTGSQRYWQSWKPFPCTSPRHHPCSRTGSWVPAACRPSHLTRSQKTCCSQPGPSFLQDLQQHQGAPQMHWGITHLTRLLLGLIAWHWVTMPSRGWRCGSAHSLCGLLHGRKQHPRSSSSMKQPPSLASCGFAHTARAAEPVVLGFPFSWFL